MCSVRAEIHNIYVSKLDYVCTYRHLHEIKQSEKKQMVKSMFSDLTEINRDHKRSWEGVSCHLSDCMKQVHVPHMQAVLPPF